jgi:hypothetical protein
MFYLNIATSNFTKGYARILYPWTEQSSGTGLIGNNRQTYTGTYPYIAIACTVNYGYTFNGWWTLPSGGTQITSANSVNVYYNDGYYNNTWYAQFL